MHFFCKKIFLNCDKISESDKTRRKKKLLPITHQPRIIYKNAFEWCAQATQVASIFIKNHHSCMWHTRGYGLRANIHFAFAFPVFFRSTFSVVSSLTHSYSSNEIRSHCVCFDDRVQIINTEKLKFRVDWHSCEKKITIPHRHMVKLYKYTVHTLSVQIKMVVNRSTHWKITILSATCLLVRSFHY